MADEEAKILEEAKRLSLSERVKHSNWKVRSAAYEDIRAKCEKVYNDDDPVLDELVGLFPKAVTDSNAPTLDKALDALNAFLAKCSEAHASRIADKTSSNMVAKCLSARPGTVAKASEAFQLFIELDQADKALAALVEGSAHKVPKVVVAALDVIHQAVSAFGAKVVPWGPILKASPPLFDSKDVKARAKIKEIVVEIARWTGPQIIQTTLGDVRAVFKTELDAAISELPPGRPQPSRLTRKAQLAAASATAVVEEGTGAAAAVAVAVAEEEQDMDIYEEVTPKDILPELKKEFWDGLEQKKWSDRKQSLVTLKELASYPRLLPGDYGDLNRELKKIITKDSMVQVVAEAISCCGMLAKGLRSSYANTSRTMFPVLLEKFKEKNAAVQKAVAEALEIMHKYCFAFLDVVEDVTAALGHTNPKVREETTKWLTDAIEKGPKKELQSLQKDKDKGPPMLAAIAKCAEDALPSLREAAQTCLVAYAVKLGSPAALEKVTAKMDDTRKKKLDEMIDEAMKAKGGRPAAPAPASRPATAAPVAAAAPSRPASTRPSTSMKAAPAVRASTSRPGTASGAAKPAKAAGGGGGGGASGEPEDEASLQSGTLTKEDVVAKFTELFGEANVKALQDAVWKTRLDAMEDILGRAPGMPEQCSVLVQGMSYIPGWGEKNFQVMAKQFEVISVLAKDAPVFSKKDAFCAITGLVDKIADMKLQGPACEALSSLSEAVGPQFVASQVHKKAAAHKNPKVLSVSITWMAKVIEEFGLQPFNVKALLDWMKEDLGSANAPVRTAAAALLGVLHRFIGPALRDQLCNDVKPALMTAIDAEFAKNPQSACTPTRVSRADAKKALSTSREGGAKASKAGAAAAAAAPAFDPDDILPRQDISDQISSAFVSKMTSSNWKERKEAMDELEEMLKGAGFRIQPQVGDLMPALKQRLGDTNRNLAVQALQLIGKLAKSMGKPFDRQGRPVLAPAIKNLSDPKPMVRSAVVEMLDAWAAAAPVDALVTELAEALAAPKCSADAKKTGMEWLTGIVTDGKLADNVGEAVKVAAVGSMDKAVEVREAASRLLTALIEHVGAAEVGQAAHTLGTAHKKAALELYAKVSGGAAPAAAAAPSASMATSRPSTAGSRTSAVRASAPAGARTSVSRNSSARSVPGMAKSVASSSASSLATVAAASDDGPLLRLDDKKEDRARKGKFKPSKFEIKPDEYTSVEEELRQVAAPVLLTLMCHKDFRKHCEAADLLKANFEGLYDNTLSCLDLVFRWSVLRIVDANMQCLTKVLDMLKALFDLLVQREYRMTDYEAKMLLPGVIEKCGHNSDRIRADHREIMRKACSVYSPLKVMGFVRDGLDSKNNRTRVECAEEVGAIVSRGNGPTPKQQEAIQAVAKLVAERDTALRKAVLSTMEVVYTYEADGIWKLLGKLTDQQKSLIEERLKYVDKELAKKGLRAGYRRADAPSEEPEVLVASTSIRIGQGVSASTSALPTAFVGQSYSHNSSNSNSRNNSPTKPSTSQVRASAPVSMVPSMDAAPSLPLPSVPSQPLPSTHTSYPPPATATEMSPLPGTPYGRKSDEDIAAEFTRCLSLLRSGSKDEAVETMKSLCYLLMELPRMSPSNVQLFKTCADELVRQLAVRTDSIFIEATTYPSSNKEIPNARACKYSLNTLMNIFQSKVMASTISEAGLGELIGVLLMRLLDKQLPTMAEGQALLKAINVLMIRVLDHSNHTNTFCALIQLLLHPHRGVTEAAAHENMEFRWYDLVVKCLIKKTKGLPQTLDSINLRQLLLACHNYFTELGRDEILARGHREDKPLRMVKTLLNELCRHKGQDIYRYTDIIPDMHPHPALIFSYIELNLAGIAGRPPGPAATAQAAPRPPGSTMQAATAALAAANAAAAAPMQVGGATGNGAPVASMLQSSGAYRPDATASTASTSALQSSVQTRTYTNPALTSSMSEHQQAKNMLATIFKRIGDKKEPEQALRELHFFMQDHPNIDVNQFLGSASEQFRNFIQKGLSRVRADITREQAASTGVPAPAVPVPSADPSAAAAAAAASAANRTSAANLAELRDRMNKIQGDLNNTQAGSNRSSSIQDLRERMRQMQQPQGP